MLGHLQNTLRRDREEVTLNIINLGPLDQVLDVLALDVFNSQLFGSRELGDKRAVVARDQGSTGSCGYTTRDGDVLWGEAVTLGSLDKLVAELVIASGSNIDDGLLG